MSDEQPPPPLRLRPRNRDDAVAPATPSIPVVVPTDPGSGISAVPGAAPVADHAPGRFRLKPKITPGAEEQETLSAFPGSSSVPSVDSESIIIPRLKLKVATANSSDPAVESMPDANNTHPSFVVPPAGPEVTDGREIGGLPPAHDQSAMLQVPIETPRMDSVEAPIEAPVSSPTAPVAPPPLVVKPAKPKAATSSPRRLILGGLVLLLLGGGTGAYFYLMQEEPPPPPPLVRRAPVPQIPKPAPAAPVVVPPVPNPELAGLDPLPPAPGSQKPEAAVAAKPTKAPVVPVMTPAFRLWLDGVRINGVTASAGSVPRVIINGRLVRPGDTIDSTEGIVFESVDTEKKCVMFKNRAGFVAAKPY